MRQRHMRDVFPGNSPSNRLGERLKAGIRSVPLPTLQRNGLDFTEPKWRLDWIETNGQIYPAFSRTRRFVAHKIALRADGAAAPYDDDAFCCVKMRLDVFAPMGAAANVSVPPDSEPFALERRHQGQKASPVLRLVRHKNVGRADHCCPPSSGFRSCAEIHKAAGSECPEWVKADVSAGCDFVRPTATKRPPIRCVGLPPQTGQRRGRP